MECTNCRFVPPLEDAGTLLLRNSAPDPHPLIRRFPYESKEQLLSLLEQITAYEDTMELHLLPGSKPSEVHGPEVWLPLTVWKTRLQHLNLVRIIEQKSFTSFMQPIVRSDTLEPFGYELLLRPVEGSPSFTPGSLFQTAQETGLHSFLDRAARISAIETSAKHLQNGLKRFVNFLPSSIYNPAFCLQHTFAAIDSLEQDPSDYVFEVVETEQITDLPHLKSIFEAYKKNGVSVALDDVGAGFSNIEVLRDLQPDFVKIDRDLVSHVDTRMEHQEKIHEIIEASRDFGAIVLAEGIERREELDVCKQLGVDLIQGYLIGKPAPHP